jgi:hypothetical protein
MKALRNLLFLLAIYASFAAQAANAQYSCVHPQGLIAATEGSIVPGDGLQLGRITRDGRPSSCTGDSATLENQTLVARDTHNFVNPYNETVCVRVEMDFTGCAGHQMQSVAYSNFVPLSPAANVIGDSGFSTIGKGSYLFSVGPNASFSVGVNEVDAGSGCPLYSLKVTYLRNCRQAGTDLTNDGLADVSVYRTTPLGATWYTLDSQTGQPVIRSFGNQGDIPTGGSDYTGDGRTDLSVYRGLNNTWYFANNPDTPGTDYTAIPWGVSEDKVVPGDFDGDGKNDVAIYRPNEGRFYILRSSDGALRTFQWGSSLDTPISGDFDGDTVSDIAIARVVGGSVQWWVLKSNYNYGFNEVMSWGIPSDRYVPGDYDGDAISDVAVFRPSTGIFYVRRSSDAQMQAFKWGVSGDVPQPADYDGDKKQDFAVYRPSNATWYIYNSASDTSRIVNWGLQFDQPMTTSYRILGAQPIMQSLTSE